MSECKYSFQEAKSKLEALCAYQERCESELLSKLYDWGLNQDDSNALIAHLITSNFLSEERFAEAYASGKMRIKKWGRIKIKLNLKQKRVSNYSIDKALKSLDYEEYLSNIRTLIVSKSLLTKSKNNFEKKIKIQKYLVSKGYEVDLVFDLVNELLND